jgi:hypothetical protein
VIGSDSEWMAWFLLRGREFHRKGGMSRINTKEIRQESREEIHQA